MADLDALLCRFPESGSEVPGAGPDVPPRGVPCREPGCGGTCSATERGLLECARCRVMTEGLVATPDWEDDRYSSQTRLPVLHARKNVRSLVWKTFFSLQPTSSEDQAQRSNGKRIQELRTECARMFTPNQLRDVGAGSVMTIAEDYLTRYFEQLPRTSTDRQASVRKKGRRCVIAASIYLAAEDVGLTYVTVEFLARNMQIQRNLTDRVDDSAVERAVHELRRILGIEARSQGSAKAGTAGVIRVASTLGMSLADAKAVERLVSLATELTKSIGSMDKTRQAAMFLYFVTVLRPGKYDITVRNIMEAVGLSTAATVTQCLAGVRGHIVSSDPECETFDEFVQHEQGQLLVFQVPDEAFDGFLAEVARGE